VPDLDQVLAPPAPSPGDRQVLEGVLVTRRGDRYARIDDSAALWGPLVGGENVDDGETIVVAIAQSGTPYVIFPPA
jgi:hypothetical protein